MGWRYQPIVKWTKIHEQIDIAISLCEVHLDDEDKLTSWTECLACAPIGSDVEELCRDLAHMWISALCWKPVNATSLRVGMTFERSVEQSVRDELAEFIERGGSLLRQQAI